MNYLVPAWHQLLNDWAYNIPAIEFDDAISHMHLFQKGGQKVGLLLTDYQPQISTKLSQLAISPDRFFSVFDYLQGISSLNGQVIDYRDFPWPKGAYFDFTNFRIFVMVERIHYATIIFDTQGKILWIDFLSGPNQGSRLLFDSRGFVSRQEKDDINIYYNPAGVWRFKHNPRTDHVVINDIYSNFCQQTEYDHLSDLISEIIQQQFLPQVTLKDKLIVTVDDQSTVPLNSYLKKKPVYSISKWHSYLNGLKQVKTGKIITDTTKSAETVRANVPPQCKVSVLPLFQSQFKLGHSQRLLEQRIAVFAEHMSADELMTVLEIIYPRLLKKPKDEAIYIMTYSPAKDAMAQQVFAEFREKHDGEFILSADEFDPGENSLDESLRPPILKIKVQRLSSSVEALKLLDKIRLLIMWGQADEFMTIAAVSVGIPILQNFVTDEVVNRQNGIVCRDLSEIKSGIEYYLDTLKNWNQSLVYNVKMLNRYSEENLLATWNKIQMEED